MPKQLKTGTFLLDLGTHGTLKKLKETPNKSVIRQEIKVAIKNLFVCDVYRKKPAFDGEIKVYKTRKLLAVNSTLYDLFSTREWRPLI